MNDNGTANTVRFPVEGAVDLMTALLMQVAYAKRPRATWKIGAPDHRATAHRLVRGALDRARVDPLFLPLLEQKIRS